MSNDLRDKLFVSFVLAPCAEDMTYNSKYSKDVSSNEGNKGGLSNSNKKQWTPDSADDEKFVTVHVSDDDDVYIDSVQITDTTNIASITVTYITKDGTKVMAC